MKNIVIFLDGTGNTLGDYNRKGHATHIRNGFDLISQSQRGKTPYNSKTVSGVGILTATVKNNSTLKDCYAIYIEGINSSIDALNGTGVLKRVQLAYQEISKVYNSGDAVHIYMDLAVEPRRHYV